MQRTLLISVVGFLLTFGVAIAAVPEGNRMQLGEISDSLPGIEMKSFYAKMEPLMLKIFGPPFSNINLKIEANLNGTDHNTGYTDNEQTLVLAGQAKRYQEYKLKEPKRAVEQIYGNMIHELAHGMYYYGNKRVTFHPQWINEGLAKTQEILVGKDLDNTFGFGASPYFDYYLDRNTVAGTMNWGSSKQTTNHGVVYNITSVAHLTLLAAASSSNDNLDFLKTLNNKIYDWVKANNETDISLAQYKNIMRGLLQDKTIDGQPAFDWYFNNPDTLTEGKLGNHLGITTEPGEIIAYAFSRAKNGQDIQETGLPNLDIAVKVIGYDDKILLSKTIKTDAEGNARFVLPKNGQSAIMTFEATANISGKPFTASMFYFDTPSQSGKLSGTLIDETGKPLPAKYIGLLKSDMTFDYKDKGVFAMTVPNSARTVTLDFLGLKQEVTKGPFTRMFAMTIPAQYIEKASQQPDSVIESGIISNKTSVQKSSGFIVGVISLIAVVIAAVAIVNNPFKRRKK